MRPGNRRQGWGVGAQRRQRGAPGWQAHHSHLQGDKDMGRIQEGTAAGRGQGGEPHQGLIGREEGGPTVISSDGQQRHGAKLLTGKVRGGMTS